MCTLIALHRAVAGAPLVVAANRDEFLDRPAEGLALRGAVIAPKDLQAGGTWLGIGPGGVFAAVTNRRGEEPDPQRRSRGGLVFEALAAPSARGGAEIIAQAPADAFNPFNFFIADAQEAFVVLYDHSPQLRTLEPGAHVIGNVDPDDRSDPKVARILERAEKAATRVPADALFELASVCREHDCGGGPLVDTCVHTSAYGTRSSCLYLQSADGKSDVLEFSEGAPCEHPYRDQTDLLFEMSLRARYEAEGETPRSAT